jgi:class 3 adenylate cyclase
VTPSRRYDAALSFARVVSRSILAAFLFAGFLSAQINPEAGAFYYKQYLPENYGGASPQNWAAVQDLRGFMYFGNTDGVLEYSGARWRKIPLSNGGVALSLAADDQGTVFVGGQGEIGFLKADATGMLNYVSLLDRIPAGDRNFGNVWKVYATKEGVLFGSFQRIFRWGPGGMKVWRPASKTKFGYLFVVSGSPYVQAGDLCRIVGDALEPVAGGETFTASNRVQEVFSYTGALTVATNDALYRSDGRKFTKWTTSVDNLLRDYSIYTVTALRNGDLAIGTLHGGLLLLTPQGALDHVIDRKSGIASDAVNSMYVDGDGSLWLMLSNGIAHVGIELPLTRFAERQGLEEIVIAIHRQNGSVYAGNMTGLNRLVSSPAGSSHFEPVSGIRGQVLVLLPTTNALLAGGQHGIYEVSGGNAKPILQPVICDMSLSIYDSKLLYAVGPSGLYVLELRGGHWTKIREVSSEGVAFRSVLEDSDGRVWVTTSSGIWRLNLTPPVPTIDRFAEKDGVPGPAWRNNVFRVGTRVVFATPKGLVQFDRERKKFVPCTAFGAMFADGTHAVSIIRQSSTGDVWISGEGYNGVLHHHASNLYTWDESPLARSGIKELYALYLDTDDVAWAAGSEGGLVRAEVWSTSVPVTPFAARLQTAQLERGEKTLFGGFGNLPAPPEITHAQNALRFLFAAPVFGDESQTKYQVRLEAQDRDWSDWRSETRKEYTNLWEGRYVFHVRARDLYGRISAEDSFSFDVLPPWYRTWGAYVLYVFAFVAAMSAVIKWRLHALAEANRKLEAIIAERTEEIRQQRDTIQFEEATTKALLLNILPASVAEELRSTGSVAPLGYDDITVCFTDFVGFTLSSEGLPPAELVAALHRYFTAFDEIVDRYGLEKLKTIGDSYMFVSGLPKRSSSHAVDAVLAALEIAEFVAKMGDSKPGWRIRIGIHSGPVVAGVVGVRKFAFDIWGETVNFASRFESSGSANRVNISSQTHELVCDFIDCEPRGPIKIKEGRKLEMYFARGIRSDLLDSDPDGAPAAFVELYKKKFGRTPRAIPSPRASQQIIQAVGGN